jgi:hypothetical protein
LSVVALCAHQHTPMCQCFPREDSSEALRGDAPTHR